KQQQEINRLVLTFLRSLASELSEKGKSAFISDTIKGVIKALSSFGIEHVNLPVILVTDMVDFIENDSLSRKKSGKYDKRNAVLEAAMVVFSNKGFHDAHVDEIAELAGVAKGTVYRYFESKEEILKEIIRGNNNKLVEGLNTIFSKEEHILELIKEAIGFYIDFFESNKELYKILTHAPWILKEVNEYFYNSIISHLQKIRRRILSLNKQGVLKTTDFYTVFYGIFGFIDGVIQKWFRRNCEYSLREELPVIIEVLFYGFVGDSMRKDEFKNEVKGAADNLKKKI
ncbi:MAG: TetR/AcrR family transcriptional regulator, partial [Spirochaetes bacterium]|nr:TetR/AcrR family transcriptional regulator [Spirochaetota bacterium]